MVVNTRGLDTQIILDIAKAKTIKTSALYVAFSKVGNLCSRWAKFFHVASTLNIFAKDSMLSQICLPTDRYCLFFKKDLTYLLVDN